VLAWFFTSLRGYRAAWLPRDVVLPQRLISELAAESIVVAIARLSDEPAQADAWRTGGGAGHRLRVSVAPGALAARTSGPAYVTDADGGAIGHGSTGGGGHRAARRCCHQGPPGEPICR
jgi:hypothetical protein